MTGVIGDYNIMDIEASGRENKRIGTILIRIAPFAMMALYIRPSGIGDYIPFAQLQKYLQVLVCIVLYVYTVYLNSRKRKLEPSIIVITIYYTFTYVIDYLLRDTNPPFGEAVASLAMCLFIYINYDRHETEMYDSFSMYYLLIAILQVYLTWYGIKINSSGLASEGLFENRNHINRFLIPGLMFCLLNSTKKKNTLYSIRTLLYLACFTNLVLFGKSGTGKMAYIVYIGMLIIFMFRPLPRFISVFSCAIYSILIFVLIYQFGIQYYLDFIIVNLLHKTPEFTGRLYIWNNAISIINSNKIFGIGSYSSYDWVLSGYMHAHQYWLQTLMSGGYVGAILMLLLYRITSSNLQRQKYLVGSKIITITIVSYLVVGIDEALTHSEMLLPIIILGSIYGRKLEQGQLSTTVSTIDSSINALPSGNQLLYVKHTS